MLLWNRFRVNDGELIQILTIFIFILLTLYRCFTLFSPKKSLICVHLTDVQYRLVEIYNWPRFKHKVYWRWWLGWKCWLLHHSQWGYRQTSKFHISWIFINSIEVETLIHIKIHSALLTKFDFSYLFGWRLISVYSLRADADV